MDERCGCLPDPLKTHSLQNYLVHWSLADLGDEEKVELAKQPDLFRTLLNLSPERRIEYFRKVTGRRPSHPSNLYPNPQPPPVPDPEIDFRILYVLEGRICTNPELINSFKDLSYEERIELAKQPNLYVTLLQVNPEERVEYFRTHTVSIYKGDKCLN